MALTLVNTSCQDDHAYKYLGPYEICRGISSVTLSQKVYESLSLPHIFFKGTYKSCEYLDTMNFSATRFYDTWSHLNSKINGLATDGIKIYNPNQNNVLSGIDFSAFTTYRAQTPKSTNLDYLEWYLKDKSEKITSSQKILSDYVDTLPETFTSSHFYEDSYAIETKISKAVDSEESFATSYQKILDWCKKIEPILEADLQSRLKLSSIERIIVDIMTVNREYEKAQKVTTRLLLFILSVRLRLNRVFSLYRLNRRDNFRKINSFLFKNLDDSHSIALVSQGY